VVMSLTVSFADYHLESGRAFRDAFIQRVGEAAKMPFPIQPTHAAPCLWF